MPTTISLPFASKIFDLLDTDSTGLLTPAKLRHVLTILNFPLSDAETSEMVHLVDRSGTRRMDFAQFRNTLCDLGYSVVESEYEKLDTDNSAMDGEAERSTPENDPHQLDLNSIPDAQLQSELGLCDLEGSRTDLLSDTSAASEIDSYCGRSQPRRGLGGLLRKANHIAMTVSDVGRSAAFYANVLGLCQIPRPDFDEHGAWFSLGSIELHLIKGVPALPNMENLIVGHISLETEHIEEVPGILRKLGVPFRKNVSVPAQGNGGELGTNTRNDNEEIVEQYFVRDPDGYYLEICNCQALEEYTHSGRNWFEKADKTSQSMIKELMEKWSFRAIAAVRNQAHVISGIKEGEEVEAEIAARLGCLAADNVDRDLLKVFVARSTVFGDICQGRSEENLERILKVSGNSAKSANNILSLHAHIVGSQTFQPPAFYENGTDFVIPATFTMPC